MLFKNKLAMSVLIALSICTYIETSAEARKRILPGRGDGMATVTIGNSDPESIREAAKQVFIGDGYSLKYEGRGSLRFSRSAGRGKDFAYGGLAGSGQWEQVYLTLHELGGGSYRLECNVYMTSGDTDPTVGDAQVLRAFGKEYQRMLRRIRRKLVIN